MKMESKADFMELLNDTFAHMSAMMLKYDEKMSIGDFFQAYQAALITALHKHNLMSDRQTLEEWIKLFRFLITSYYEEMNKDEKV